MAHTGGCHCGKVRFSADVDLSKPVIECNCSHCQGKGFLLAFGPRAALELEQGEDALVEYRFNTHKIAHQFCPFEPESNLSPLEWFIAGRSEQTFTWLFPDAIRDGSFTMVTRDLDVIRGDRLDLLLRDGGDAGAARLEERLGIELRTAFRADDVAEPLAEIVIARAATRADALGAPFRFGQSETPIPSCCGDRTRVAVVGASRTRAAQLPRSPGPVKAKPAREPIVGGSRGIRAQPGGPNCCPDPLIW